MILSGLPVIIRTLAPAASACLARLVLEPSVNTTLVANRSGTCSARRVVASEIVATGCAVARLLQQPDKLMAKLSLSVDDQNSCHAKPTSCTARPFQDCGDLASCLSLPNRTSNEGR